MLSSGADDLVPGCNFSGTDCGAVISSPYARILGISLIVWGAGYLAILLPGLVALQLLPDGKLKGYCILAVAALSTISVITAIWCIWIMLTELQTLCPWCLLTHLANVSFWIATVWLVWHLPRPSSLADQQWVARPAVLLAAVALTACAARLQWAVLDHLHDRPQFKISAVNGIDDPVLAFTSNPQRIKTAIGNTDSASEVVMLMCYTCPHCRDMYRILKEESAETKFAIHLRFSPFSGECNPLILDPSLEHPNACELANLGLAVAAEAPDQFEAFSGWLLEHQESLSYASALAQAHMHVSEEALQEALTNAAKQLELDLKAARELKPSGIPTLYFRDGEYRGPIAEETIQAAIAKELN